MDGTTADHRRVKSAAVKEQKLTAVNGRGVCGCFSVSFGRKGPPSSAIGGSPLGACCDAAVVGPSLSRGSVVGTSVVTTGDEKMVEN